MNQTESVGGTIPHSSTGNQQIRRFFLTVMWHGEAKKYKRRYHLWESRGVPKRMNVLKKSRHLQRWFLRNPWIRPMVTFNLAAIKIQALIRGCIVRLHGKNWRNKIKRKKGRGKQLDKYLTYLDQFSGSNSRYRPSWLDDGYSSWCAVRIQSKWRMALIRRKFLLKRDIYQISALEIQSLYTHYIRNKFPPAEPLPQEIPPPPQMKTIECYARIIQKAWRSYCNLRVYRYLRDIILNKLQGIPADLLRSIIPMETDFLDRAAGIHVRFRLGGAMFPPKIFYKIYTHRPLCDINAFAPRNYSIERRHQLDPATLHNKVSSPSLSSTFPGNASASASAATGTGGRNSSFIRRIQSSIRVGRAFYDATITPPLVEGMDDWYHREENRNNPWRVISTELEDVFDSPPPWVLLDQRDDQQMQDKDLKRKKKKKSDQSHHVTSSPTSAYHFSRLRRQQDILLERKRRKREWMLKAYTLTAGSTGMVGGNDNDLPLQEPHTTTGSGSVDREGGGSGGQSVGRDAEQQHRKTSVSAAIEMCDSYSSRSDLPMEYQQRQTQAAAGSAAIGELSQFDHNQLLAAEKEIISNGLQFRYSDSKPHLQSPSLPLIDPNPSHSHGHSGTDDALLKWSLALDYEEYSRGWLSMATSLPSETSYGLVYESHLKLKS